MRDDILSMIEKATENIKDSYNYNYKTEYRIKMNKIIQILLQALELLGDDDY